MKYSNHILNTMTSSNGNIFRVTGPLCGEFTGDRWIPRTKASDAELWCFLWSEAGNLRRHQAHYDVIVMKVSVLKIMQCLNLVILIFIYIPAPHNDVIKWKHFPRYWLFVRGIHRSSVSGIHWSPVDSPRKGQWRGALMLSLICAWTNGWANNRDAGDLRWWFDTPLSAQPSQRAKPVGLTSMIFDVDMRVIAL